MGVSWVLELMSRFHVQEKNFALHVSQRHLTSCLEDEKNTQNFFKNVFKQRQIIFMRSVEFVLFCFTEHVAWFPSLYFHRTRASLSRPQQQQQRRPRAQRPRYPSLPATKPSHHPITPLSITHRRRRQVEPARAALVEEVAPSHNVHPSHPTEPEVRAASVVVAPLVAVEGTTTRGNPPRLPYLPTHPLRSTITKPTTLLAPTPTCSPFRRSVPDQSSPSMSSSSSVVSGTSFQKKGGFSLV